MKSRSLSLSCFLAIWIAVSLSACSADWPAFRHDILRSGEQVNNGPLTDPAKVAGVWTTGWTFPASAGVTLSPAPGGFHAGPVVYKGTVYIGNSNGYFYAIDASNGHLKWQYPLPTQPSLTQTFLSNPSSEGIASSAFITNIQGKDAVVFGAPDRSIGAGLGSGRLFALDISNGTEIWKSPEIAKLLSDGVTHEQIGYSSPLVFNNHVYIGVADHGDDPIQRGKVMAVRLNDGTIDNGFSFFSTGAPRGGGVWGSVAGFDGIYLNTGNSNIGGPNPLPNHALSLLRLDRDTGNIVWGWQPVPYDLDQDPDWSATPSVMLASCGALAVSVQKDGWTWAVNTGNGTAGPPSVRWAFPTGPWVSSGFTAADGTVHGDQRYLRPGVAWNDVYVVQTGGLNVTTNAYDGFRHIYALNACASDPDRIRWILDIPSSYGGWYSIGPPTVTHGIVYVGTDQGHLVIIADPSVSPATGWRCTDPDVPSALCIANGFSLVPDPTVLKDIDLGSGPISTEPALVGDPVYVSTEGGNVIMLKPDP
jgi:outer membrane protein assembly factor BamB